MSPDTTEITEGERVKSLSIGSSDPTITTMRKSYVGVSFLIFIYGLSISLAVPAFPKLTLSIVDGNESKAAYYYGLGTFVRYIVEFIFAPVMGTIADIKGRRPILLLSYIVNSSEYFLLALYPNLPMLFICRTISGIGDTGIATSYTIFSDIASYNYDDLTVKFGELSAVFGISFLLGPALGGVLTDISARLCLGVSGLLALFSAICCYIIQEETVDINGQRTTVEHIIQRNKILLDPEKDHTQQDSDDDLLVTSPGSTSEAVEGNSVSVVWASLVWFMR